MDGGVCLQFDLVDVGVIKKSFSQAMGVLTKVPSKTPIHVKKNFWNRPNWKLLLIFT